MSSARRLYLTGLKTLVALGAVLAACNDVIGIEDPNEIPAEDAGPNFDVARGGSAGRSGSNAGGSSGGNTAGSGGQSTADAARDDSPRVNDAFVADLPAPRDISFGDRGAGGTPGTGGSGGSGGAGPADGGNRADANDGGLLAAPGAARGTCGFLDIKDANADTTLFTSTQGSAGRRVAGGNEIVEIFLTNFMGGVQRNLNVRLRAPFASGVVLPLDDATTVEYYDVKTGAGWSSTAVMPPSGTITVTAVAGASFSFTITSAKLASVLMGTGTVTLNGSGNANPQ